MENRKKMFGNSVMSSGAAGILTSRNTSNASNIQRGRAARLAAGGRGRGLVGSENGGIRSQPTAAASGGDAGRGRETRKRARSVANLSSASLRDERATVLLDHKSCSASMVMTTVADPLNTSGVSGYETDASLKSKEITDPTGQSTSELDPPITMSAACPSSLKSDTSGLGTELSTNTICDSLTTFSSPVRRPPSSISASPSKTFNILFPEFSYVRASDLMATLQVKESHWVHSVDLLPGRHPDLQPRMRTILIEWLAEVSDVYHLQRETYYLAIEYLDRYLSVEEEPIRKAHLQLVGVTCLFIAAKVEEIYPPAISKFAYVTDGACAPADIITMELVIVKRLDWDLYPITINNCLELFAQLHSHYLEAEIENAENQSELYPSGTAAAAATAGLEKSSSPLKSRSPKRQRMAAVATNAISPIKPLYSSPAHFSPIHPHRHVPRTPLKEVSAMTANYRPGLFRQVSQVLDMVVQHLDCRRFKNSILAAATLYHFIGEKAIFQVTGYEKKDLIECIAHLECYVQILRDTEDHRHGSSSSTSSGSSSSLSSSSPLPTTTGQLGDSAFGSYL